MLLTKELLIKLVLIGKRSSLILLLFLIGCSSSSYIEVNDYKINVEIADNDLERSKGLMFREELCSNCGMLFIYDEEDERSFWMKNTLIPLKVVFIDENFTVINIENAAPCNENVCKTYNGNGKYVLEVNPRINVKVGDKVGIHL